MMNLPDVNCGATPGRVRERCREKKKKRERVCEVPWVGVSGTGSNPVVLSGKSQKTENIPTRIAARQSSEPWESLPDIPT